MLVAAPPRAPDQSIRDLGIALQRFKRIGSTQTHAKKIAQTYARDRMLIVSATQTASYGRMQRHWYSPVGGLWFSLILKPSVSPALFSPVTLLMGLVVAETIQQCVRNVSVSVKWPNDVLVNNKKICGILTEMQSEIDRVQWSVIGVGINLNNSISNRLKPLATSLKEEGIAPLAPLYVLDLVMHRFFTYYNRFLTTGFKPFKQSYQRLSSLIGKHVKLQIGKQNIQARVDGFDKNGGMIITKKDGSVDHIYTGEITG
ncbi:MAG: biotin--[acetyl-CoA-carboxylase] ligase [Elusimicrobia bacterium]|nr:biotin--[acetyl-CoA-carboxylase] ligase [Elusimicrobiota bacterium]MBD3412113.1 biotin--[acetyl-CoA-carboxylase] ligase [Elusimicrobiota bacterium]